MKQLSDPKVMKERLQRRLLMATEKLISANLSIDEVLLSLSSRGEHWFAGACTRMNDQSLRQGKAKQLYLKTTPFFSREKEELPQAKCTCMYMYMYVCVLVHVHVCVHVCTCNIYMYMYMYASTCTCMCTCVYM